MWEKKLSSVDFSGSNPHCVDGTRDRFHAMSEFVAALNGVSLDGTTLTSNFAGHTDWRLPTIGEPKSY